MIDYITKYYCYIINHFYVLENLVFSTLSYHIAITEQFSIREVMH